MTILATPTRRRRRPHVKSRRARQAQAEQNRRVTDQILQAGTALAAAAAAAATVTQAQLTDAELQAWRQDLEARLATAQQHPEQNPGFIEEQIALGAREPLRLLAQRAAQAKANATPCGCPQGQTELVNQKYLSRQIDSRFGQWVVFRRYGWCSHCEVWHFPADYALGLAQHAPASPYVQEVAALLVSKMPPEQAVLVAERFGLKLSRCRLHREAHRQGLKAEAARAASLAQLDRWEDLQQLARATEGPPAQPFTRVIQIDAWNIRERDAWGQTEALIRQLYREAIDCGLGQTNEVLVIADGAVWIWNAVHDRFPDARQRLDLYHADQPLWTVAHELYGPGTPEAAQWVRPLLQQIRKDQTPALLKTLQELQPGLDQALHKKLQTQIEYFESHQNRMHYRQIIQARKAVAKGTATPAQHLKANEPLGSGAIESTCRQYQCRFKRTGQFWTMPGDEALRCLETFWRNGRWHELYPHVKLTSPSLN